MLPGIIVRNIPLLHISVDAVRAALLRHSLSLSDEDAQLMRTSKPSCASFSAIAAPMPREPPVTIAKLIVYSIL